tara:strand:- start:415 stop:864 length:450 start_codon:yes stop_codon:yes gene_type:complete
MQQYVNNQSNTIINEIIQQVLKVDAERFGTSSYVVKEITFDYLNTLDDATQLDRDDIESITRDIIYKHKKANQSYSASQAPKSTLRRKIKKHLSIDNILIKLCILLIITVIINVNRNTSEDTVSSNYVLDNTHIVVTASPRQIKTHFSV